MTDASAFAIRGVIEGFYGTPWTWAQRMALMPRLSALGFNAFLYGPKDDAYIRAHWRSPYDADTLARVDALRAACAGAGIDFWYLLAPGFSIEYSREEEFTRMMEKYAQLYALGVRRFGLLFDDIPDHFQYESDRAAYPTLVDAHIALSLRVYGALKAMDGENRLVVCPTEYWGDGRRGYLPRLGRALPADVPLFYTGETICAHTLTIENARYFAALTGKRPLYWDNYPVNDSNMAHELHIGPLTGREAGLERYAEGIVFNPMEYLESSMIALHTAGDYLRDSRAYQPHESHARAIASVAGEKYVPAVRALHGMCYRSCLTRHGGQFPAHGVGSGHHPEFLAFVRARDLEALAAFARGTLALLEELAGCPNAAFLAESARWREAACAFCRAALEGARTGDAGALEACLRRDEEVMKYEAEQLIALLRAPD